ncbi:hypothetical protein HYO65_gp042 [Tenacibaculum phage PTm1]|uniref:Uncharacterized protein n=2 Tax=Shirahamavirus PTm1 TaxID=2846435 RepID=A0A5S9EQI0_9CAUD|nr:hypothetical protein HYO65_gp042 [Tenacibaculum phage PTm1]BBI90434.1 hypothetical protein [Tenacibaculum phage PTm1]BBI90741.1 hypothetical protein [Tenacibaculum phage PTm5]
MATVKLKHDFFHIALASFISDFSKNIQPYRELINGKVPVSIINTGDEVFLSTMLFKTDEDRKKLYSHNPRISFSVNGISPRFDEVSSPHVLGRVTTKNESTEMDVNSRANVRGIPATVVMSYEMIMSNIDQYFKFVDVMLTIFSYDQVFEFVYGGTVHRGSYRISSDDYTPDVNFSLGHDTEKRRRILTNSLDVKLKFPSFDVYSANGNPSEIFDENQKMNKLVHNVYINGNEDLVSRRFITKSK